MQPKKATKAKPESINPGDSFIVERDLRNFCAQTGQDLGQLLAVILGELNYALSTANPSVRDRSMAIALSAAEKALHLSSNLRYLGNGPTQGNHPTDLTQLVLDCVEVLEPELNARGIRLTALTETPAAAAVDPATLKHLVTNLVLRTAEALTGGGEMHITLKQTEDHQELVLASKALSLGLEPSYPQRQETRPEGSTGPSPFFLAKSLLEAQGGSIRRDHTPEGYPRVTVNIPQDPKLPPLPTFENRRNHRRVRVRFPGEVVVAGNPPLGLEVTTLSERGAYLAFSQGQTARGLKPNQTGSLKIFYFDGQSVDIEEFRIASLDTKANPPGVGIEFVRLDSRARNVLAALVRSHRE